MHGVRFFIIGYILVLLALPHTAYSADHHAIMGEGYYCSQKIGDAIRDAKHDAQDLARIMCASLGKKVHLTRWGEISDHSKNCQIQQQVFFECEAQR